MINLKSKVDKLRTLGYLTAGRLSLDDAYLLWLLARGATSHQMNKAEVEFLVVKGFTTGALDDRWNRYLRSLTYSGSRQDMENKFWLSVNSN